jgi:hypothetical protein
MGLKREPVRTGREPEYPTADEYAMGRRAFIGMLGLAAAGIGTGCSDDSTASGPGAHIRGDVMTVPLPEDPQPQPAADPALENIGAGAGPQSAAAGGQATAHMGEGAAPEVASPPAQPQSPTRGSIPMPDPGKGAAPKAASGSKSAQDKAKPRAQPRSQILGW